MHHRGTRMTAGSGEGRRSGGGGERGKTGVHRISHISEPRDVAEIPNHSHLESTLFLVHPVARPPRPVALRSAWGGGRGRGDKNRRATSLSDVFSARGKLPKVSKLFYFTGGGGRRGKRRDICHPQSVPLGTDAIDVT